MSRQDALRRCVSRYAWLICNCSKLYQQFIEQVFPPAQQAADPTGGSSLPPFFFCPRLRLHRQQPSARFYNRPFNG
jgi:hypothetical protein